MSRLMDRTTRRRVMPRRGLVGENAGGGPPSVWIGVFMRGIGCFLVAAIAAPTIRAEAQLTPFAPTQFRVLHGDEPPPIASVAVTPAALVIPSGASQRFTVAVVGAAMPITWTATGGTVTTDGMFTAGKTGGRFQVTATSDGGTRAVAQVEVVALLPGTGYVSDRPWTSMTNGWGPVEKDRSNGEASVGDGRPLALKGVTYTKGLGAHGLSDIRYALNGTCTAFTAIVGIDDETAGGGTVVFQVWLDGVKGYDSGVMTGTSAGAILNLALVGARELALVVADGGDGNTSDHADWADAKVTCPADVTAPVVTAVTPAPGATKVPTNANVTITFSEPMDPATLNSGTIFLVAQPR
jgi:hypothetical protein